MQSTTKKKTKRLTSNRNISKLKVPRKLNTTVLFAFHDIKRIELNSIEKKIFSLESCSIFFLSSLLVMQKLLLLANKKPNQNNRSYSREREREKELSRANDMFDDLFRVQTEQWALNTMLITLKMLVKCNTLVWQSHGCLHSSKLIENDYRTDTKWLTYR